MHELHKALVKAIIELRKTLAATDLSGSFRLDIEVQGRVQGGDARIEYKLGEQYSSDNTTGDELPAVVDEYLRRCGWAKRHQAQMLTFTGELQTPKPEDEIPF